MLRAGDAITTLGSPEARDRLVERLTRSAPAADEDPNTD